MGQDMLQHDLGIIGSMTFINREDWVCIGILCDYDLSVTLNEEEILLPFLGPRKRRCGMALFMAHELLDYTDLSAHAHLYRHDLESFLYVMIWIALGYKGSEDPKRRDPLKKWRKCDWESLSSKKYRLLTANAEYSDNGCCG